MKNLVLVLSNCLNEVRELVNQGFCPVECAIGEVSVMDNLCMDHHGFESHREPVALRAYRDHFGARANDPRFVGVGIADADMTFAVASLAGILPHPNRVVLEILPQPIKNSLTKDLSSLVQTISRVDIDPVGLDILSMPGGDMLLTWNAMNNNARDSLGFHVGVGLWRNLTEGNLLHLKSFLEAAKTSERLRVEASLADYDERLEVVNRVPIIKGSRVHGFSEWYDRCPNAPVNTMAGWGNHVVVAWLEKGGNVTIGCPNVEIAEILFGRGGLKNVFSKLKPIGFGGRETVGGSPRGERLTWEQVEEVARVIGDCLLV
jgi:hypothetical protein